MMDIVSEAALNIDCLGFVPPESDNLVYRLPYVWAFALCCSGRRLGFMQWLRQLCSALGLTIESIQDGGDGSVLFVAVPIQKGVA